MRSPFGTTVLARAVVGVDWLWRQWQRLHVSRRGMYSLERLHLFHDYQHTHSLAWSFVVGLLTPLPSLLFIVSLEAIPLQPPSAGWRANGTTWLRLWLFGVVITLGLLFQAREMVPNLPLSARQAVVVSVVTSTGYTVVFVTVAALWRFPTPFSTVLGVAPFVGCLALALIAVVGRSQLLAIDRLGRPITVYAQMIAAQCTLAFVYPLYNAMFVLLGPREQSFFFLLLPVIKLTMKNVVARISSDMEDLVPELALFSVELSNALYMVTCMQNAGSMTTSLVIIALDAANSLLSLRSVDEVTSIVAELQAAHIDIQQRDLLALVQLICHDGSITATSSDTSSASLSVSPQGIADTLTAEQKRLLVEQTLRALFQCEYLVLTEYIECAMPLVYAAYLAVLVQLPNAQFYAHARTMTPATLRTTLALVLGYAALEALSLVLLHALLRRKLRISALHQLAFVLETQRALIQGKMLVWAPFILQFTLLHCGVDFTFRFAFEES